MSALPAIRYPRHPAHIDAYVEVLGPSVAVRFLIAFGGTPLYFPDDPCGRSQAEALIGAAQLRELSARMPSNRAEVPMPKNWLIRSLHAEGLSVSQICRTLKTTSTNVKRTLRDARAR
ncbi:helix-turn-helix domain-containing protein [Primorskyibacter sp. 2E233]|uniref:helix-turn-helix domain-containing protein n=1 Tax=Primorskyibacter sp. 2E233 TaxID=3413431 RepID=UPI003BEF861A